MNPQKKSERAAQLQALINKYAYEYHVHDKPSVSDEVYDSLFAELKQLEADNPAFITPDSPTQRVGGTPLDAFRKKKHLHRVLSLNDVFSPQEVHDWLGRISKLQPEVEKAQFWGDIKMDGLACILVYKDGILDYALTRGDGFVGEDITHNVKTIASVPIRLSRTKEVAFLHNGRTEVRGEIVMHKDDFTKINKLQKHSNENSYANPRNLAAGTMRQLDPRIAAQRKLYFRPYDILHEQSAKLASQQIVYSYMSLIGFLENMQARLLQNVDDIFTFVQKWQEKRHELPFNTDGLVIKINDRRLYEALGVVGKNPRAAIAYKYPAETATTMVKDIFISIGRTGAATPVAILNLVFLAGSTVQMATLHNQAEIERKDIRIGDTVIVHKAGDIIPEIIQPVTELRTGAEKEYSMANVCPECGTLFVKPATEVVWRCPNTSCPARTWRHIQHFASKAALNIEGLGEKNVQSLLDAGVIKDAADLYTITIPQVRRLERFADLSAANLVYAIAEKKNPPLAKFLYALGIRHVGAQTAVDVAKTFRTFDAIAQATLEELCEVNGIGLVVAESIVSWFADDENKRLIEKFKHNGVSVQPESTAAQTGALVGLKIAITGSLQAMGRERAADYIREQGGVFQSSVGKETTHLVVAGSIGASKLAKAEKFGTRIIDEETFLKMIQQT